MLLVIAALFATLHWNDAKAGTLCQDYGGVYFYRTVGAGTAYLKSSDLGGSSANYNIYISGDFEIDNNFTFLNNVIKIAPGIKITVKANYKTLTLDNTKLFACSQRWKGITLEYAAIITTKNNTRIEDADAAITMSQSGYYTIQNTTFDRNYVGMDFVSSGSGSISNNVNFTCNSALNGGGTSFAGIKLANYSLSVGTLANPYVIFNGLQYGIYATSSSSPVSIIGRSLKFENIATNAIYIQKGSLDLESCSFYNFDTKAVNIPETYVVKINNCLFEQNISLSSSTSTIYGIHLTGFTLNSSTQIYNSTFNIVNPEYHSTDAILIEGGIVGNGTHISIYENDFLLSHSGSTKRGIHIKGAFTSSSPVTIWNNNF